MVSEGKHEGHRRERAIVELAQLLERGIKEWAALKAVARAYNVHRETINRWAKKCSGRPREQWAELLMPLKLRPREDRLRDRLWRSMRILRSFTYGQLAAVTDAPTGNLRHYIVGLHRAGYLRRDAACEAGPAEVIWRLVRDTGPVAPVLRRGQGSGIYDCNSRTLYSFVPDSAEPSHG